MNLMIREHPPASGLAKSLRVVWSRKFSLVFAAGVTFCASAFAILSLEPTYEGTTLLLSGQGSVEQSANGVRTPSENETLAQIAQSDEVVRAAIARVQDANLMTASEPGRGTLIARVRTMIHGGGVAIRAPSSAIDAAIPAVKRRLRVRTEITSNIISISFRDKDPTLAASFANALAQAFVDRQIDMISRPGAVDFFLQQKQRFDEEFSKAADELNRLSAEKGLYAIEQQRELLLRRLSESAAAIAANRAAIADKLAQRRTLGDQLKQLGPVARNPYVSGLVDKLTGDRNNRHGAPDRSLDTREWTKDPPLLLVRVYQESMMALFKINAEIAGARLLEEQYQEERAKLRGELDQISRYTERIEALRRAKAQAALNSDTYAKRLAEEKITADLNVARFSSLKVMQKAAEPTQPAFPNYGLFLAAAAIFSTTLGIAFALLRAPRR